MKVLLYILGYIILGFITAFVIERLTRCDKGDALGWGSIWPLVWFFTPVLLLIGVVLSGFEKLADLWDDLEKKYEMKKISKR